MTETLAIDGNAAPQQWSTLGVSNHYLCLLNFGDNRKIYTLAPDIFDSFTVANTVERAISELTEVKVRVTFGPTSQGTASLYGLRVWVYAGAVLKGYAETNLSANTPSGTVIDFPVAVSMDQAEADAMEIRFESFGSGWGFGSAIIQIDKAEAIVTFSTVVIEPQGLIVLERDRLAGELQLVRKAVDLEGERFPGAVQFPRKTATLYRDRLDGAVQFRRKGGDRAS